MPTPKLTLREQRKLAKALPPRVVRQAKKNARTAQSGNGIFRDISRGIGKITKPITSITKAIGPTVLKEIVVPVATKRLSGRGIKLAGAGKKKRRR